MAEENDVTANKLAEENQVQQVTKEPQQITKEPQRVQQVTTKNPKKVEAGKRLAESNRRRREEKKREQAKLEASGVNQYHGIVIGLGVMGGLGYYIYRTKKGQAGGEVKDSSTTCNPTVSQQPSTKANKFEMD